MAQQAKGEGEKAKRRLYTLDPARLVELRRVAQDLFDRGIVAPEKGRPNHSATIAHLIHEAAQALPPETGSPKRAKRTK